jgi:uncharacterized membrane protein YhaH (DUF805 family)
MHIDLSTVEQSYSRMSDEQFESLRWAELTEAARPIYEQELRRRWPDDAEERIARARQERDVIVTRKTDHQIAHPPLFSFDGRLSRRGYWIRILFINAFFIVLGNVRVFYLASTVQGRELENSLMYLLMLLQLACLAVFVPQIVMRLHDLGRPGWHYWLCLVPLYNLYLALLLLFQQGTTGPNAYGEDPVLARARLTSRRTGNSDLATV